MMHSRFGITSFVFIILLFHSMMPVLAASLVSTVDRNKVALNETLVLTVQLNQQADSSALSLKLLERDFDVLNVRPFSSSSVNMINGKTSKTVTTQWKITLAPKRQGTLTIPAFEVTGLTSTPISIAVDSSVSIDETTSPLSVSVKASAIKALPKQQIIVTVELSAKSGISNLDGSALTLNNAEVIELGQTAHNRIDNGVARQIIELKYAVFAKKTGVIDIPALTFSGLEGAQRSFFGNRGKRVVARSKALSLPINTPPISSHSWLPAQNVEIRSELSGDQSRYQVGSPITRKVIINVQGQSAEAIPPILQNNDRSASSNGATGYKTYDDKPQLQTETTAEGLTGIRIEAMAIVPSIAGELTLPEVRLNWWNVSEERWQEAILPAETLMIADSVSNQHDQNLTNAESTLIESDAADHGSTTSPRLWQAISALLLLVCVVQFVLLKRKSSSNSHSRDQSLHNELNDEKAWNQLQSFLKQGDAHDIRRGLVQWIRANTHDNRRVTLTSFASRVNSDALSNAIDQLEAHLYSKNSSVLNKDTINALHDSLNMVRQELKNNAKHHTQNTQQTLKPLYPTQ